jgi:hypothetical protein
MTTEFAPNQNANAQKGTIAQKVKTSLHHAEQQAESLRKNNTRLLVTGLACSSGATLVAGITATIGPVVGEGIPGWRAACIVAALFGFISTLSMGLNQRLRFSQRLSTVTQCVGKLRSLDLLIMSGEYERQEIVKKYTEIVETYPEFVK